MKRIVGLVCFLVLAFALAGCGDKEEEITVVTPSPTTAPDYYHDCGGTITLGEYKGLTYDEPVTEVTEEEVDEEIKSILEYSPNYEEDESRADTEVADGDILNIDYLGKVDGEAFSGGTAEDAILEIGSDRFIDGFEDALIGKKVGETCDIDVTFPETYSNNPDLAGKDAVFTVTINYVCKVNEEITDAYVSEYTDGDYETVEEFRTYLKESLEEEKEANAENEKLLQLINQVIENSTITVEQEDVDYYYADAVSVYEYYATMYGQSLEDFIVMMGLSEDYEAFETEMKKQAEETVKQYMVLEAIVEAEKIELTDEEYATAVKEYMDTVGATDQETFESTYGVDYIRYCILTDKAWDVIISTATASTGES